MQGCGRSHFLLIFGVAEFTRFNRNGDLHQEGEDEEARAQMPKETMSSKRLGI